MLLYIWLLGNNHENVWTINSSPKSIDQKSIAIVMFSYSGFMHTTKCNNVKVTYHRDSILWLAWPCMSWTASTNQKSYIDTHARLLLKELHNYNYVYTYTATLYHQFPALFLCTIPIHSAWAVKPVYSQRSELLQN